MEVPTVRGEGKPRASAVPVPGKPEAGFPGPFRAPWIRPERVCRRSWETARAGAGGVLAWVGALPGGQAGPAVPVTRLAGGGEPGRRVRRGGRRLVLRLVARETRAWRAPVDVVRVATAALRDGVHAQQRERRAVVEGGAPPRAAVPVARGAVGREAGRRVVRVPRRAVVGLVTAEALARRAPEHVVPVATGAGRRRVRARQREVLVVGEPRRGSRPPRGSGWRPAGSRPGGTRHSPARCPGRRPRDGRWRTWPWSARPGAGTRRCA